MNLQQLRYVVATADVGTMTAAAATLHVAQPALSRAVRALEHEIGVTIFARDGRGLRLTDEGRDVVALAERIVADVERLALLGRSSTLHICATKAQARELGSPLVTRLGAERDDRAMLTVVDSRDDVFEAVRSGRSQLGLVELPAPSDLTATSLGWQEFVLIYPPGWDLPEPLPVRLLDSVPLLGPPAGDWRRDVMESGLRALGVEPKIVGESAERDRFCRLVIDGVGATFSYGRQAAAARAAGAKVTALEPLTVREVGVVHTGEPTDEAAAFVELLRAEARHVLLHQHDPRVRSAGRVAGPLLMCRRAPQSAPTQAALAR